MAIIAADACTRHVSNAPMPTNTSIDQKPQSDIDANACRKFGYSSRLGIALCNSSMPNSSSAKPMIVCPTDFSVSFFELKKNKLTIDKKSGKLNTPLPSPNPNRVMIHAVTVVPILAPIITATAPANERSPAFTKLTTITVVADDDWMAAVTIVPVKMPFSGRSVILPSTWRILLPAVFCKPSLISFMANRNTANAPTNFITIIRMLKNVISFSFFYLSLVS